MHELSLCQSLFNIIYQEAERIQCRKITCVILEVGRLAAVDKSALLFAFKAVTINTIAQEAALEMIEIEAKAVCENCGKTVTIENYYEACDVCQLFSLRVIQGEELRVQSIEVE